MLDGLLLPGTIGFKDSFAIYMEGVKEFIDEILYRIAKFELRF